MASTIKTAEEIEEARAIMPSVTRVFNALDTFRVNSPATWLRAGEKILEIKEKVKEIKRIRKSILDPINTAKDNTMAFFDPAIEKCEEIVNIIGRRMSDWKAEQDRIEEDKTRKAEAEAREKEQIERERLRKEAEVREAEARRAQKEADAKRRQAEELARKENFARSEKARLEAEESQRKADALKQESKEIKQEVKDVEVEAKEVKTKTEKVAGLSFRTYWKFEIVNENLIPRNFLKADAVKIGSFVTEQKELAKIPGVRIFSEEKTVG
jgi:DNA repair exonuclease SbcCD ATPase subunit